MQFLCLISATLAFVALPPVQYNHVPPCPTFRACQAPVCSDCPPDKCIIRRPLAPGGKCTECPIATCSVKRCPNSEFCAAVVPSCNSTCPKGMCKIENYPLNSEGTCFKCPVAKCLLVDPPLTFCPEVLCMTMKPTCNNCQNGDCVVEYPLGGARCLGCPVARCKLR